MAYCEDDRNRGGRLLGCECRRAATGRDNHGYLSTNQIGRQRWQPIVVTIRPAEFDRDILAFDIANLAQALAERDDEAGPFDG